MSTMMTNATRAGNPILFAALLTMLAGLAVAEVIRLSDPVEQTDETETFGSPFDDSAPLVPLEEIASDGEAYLGRSVRIDARVSEVCQKKGCFFIAQQGQSALRISFKDYAFFVPTDIGGKRVALIGEVVARDLTQDEADHFAEDLGKADATMQPGTVYEIVAASVRVPR